MPSLEQNRSAYIQLRNRVPVQQAQIDTAFSQARDQLAEKQRALARKRSESLRWEQGVVMAWAHARASSHRALHALIEQPWLVGLGLGPAADLVHVAEPDGLPAWLRQLAQGVSEPSLIVTCALVEHGPLVLDLQLLRTPVVLLTAPRRAVNRLSPLTVVALDSLAMEDGLVDVVETCARRLGLGLGVRGRTQPVLSEEVERAYLHQRSAWLTQDGWLGGAPSTDVAALLGDIAATEKRLVSLARQRDEVRRAPSAADERQYGLEYEELLRLPHVAGIDVLGNVITLTTDDVYIYGRRIGAFRVTLDFGNLYTSYRNLTNPSSEDGGHYDHPHISAGSACYGNIGRAVADYLAGRQPQKLVPLIIDYLHSYNEDSVYRNLSYW